MNDRRRWTFPLFALLALLLFVLPACEADEAGPGIPPFTDNEEVTTTTLEIFEDDEEEPVLSGEEEPLEGVDDASLARVPEIVDEVSPSVVAIVVSGPQGGGQGSGVILTPDGYIVTNNHVVSQAQEVEVVLASGEAFPGELVGTDPSTDLAVVKVETDEPLPAAEFAAEVPDVGELAVAIGNPFGFAGTATAGIISGLERNLPVGDTALIGLIQTDAPISPGNSGGALVDGEGTVVGVNVAAIPPQAGATSIGFAIPSPLVVAVAESLIETGTVDHPFLGIAGVPLTENVAEQFGIEPGGVIVAQLSEGGPAAEAGLEVGDVIVELGGAEVNDLADLLLELREHDPGETVTVTVFRDGEEMEIEVELGTLPS